MLKRIYIVIVFVIVTSIIVPNSVNASRVNSIESKENTNNILLSNWDSMFGLERINIFSNKDDRYFAKTSSNAAMQQIIDLRDYENSIDSNNMFFGLGMNVIAHKDLQLFISVDFYKEKPSEVNYDKSIYSNRIYKKVNPTKDKMTSLLYNVSEHNLVGNDNQEYSIPTGARYARLAIRAHSNTKEFSLSDKLDIELNNIMFEVRDMNNNLDEQVGYTDTVEMYSDEVLEFIRVVKVVKDWAPTAKLQMNIMSDMVKEVILPNGVAVTQNTDFYVTENGVYVYEATLDNGVKIEKSITVDTIDNSSPVLHMNFNQEKKSNQIDISAFDTDSGVKEIRYAWSEKETKPLEYERLSSDHIKYKNDCGVWFLHVLVEDFAGNLTQYCSNEIETEFKPVRKHRVTDSIVEQRVKEDNSIEYKDATNSENGYLILDGKESTSNMYGSKYQEGGLETEDGLEHIVWVVFKETGPHVEVIYETLL